MAKCRGQLTRNNSKYGHWRISGQMFLFDFSFTRRTTPGLRRVETNVRQTVWESHMQQLQGDVKRLTHLAYVTAVDAFVRAIGDPALESAVRMANNNRSVITSIPAMQN